MAWGWVSAARLAAAEARAAELERENRMLLDRLLEAHGARPLRRPTPPSDAPPEPIGYRGQVLSQQEAMKAQQAVQPADPPVRGRVKIEEVEEWANRRAAEEPGISRRWAAARAKGE